MKQISGVVIFSFMIMIAAIAACSSNTENLTDEAAAAVLQASWKHDERSFALGPHEFHTDNSTGTDIKARLLPMYRALAKKGLLTLENEWTLKGGFREGVFLGWDDIIGATVDLTPAGAKLGTLHRTDPSKSGFVTFVFGEYQVEKVVSNEGLDMNGEKYRVCQGTHVFVLKPEFADAMALAAEPTVRELRFRALLKFDAIESKWKLQVADIGPRSVDFGSQNVPTAIAHLRQTGSIK